MTVLSWQQLVSGGNADELKGGTALTVGCFDGPHSGHDVLFDAVFHAAAEQNLSPGIITFSRPLPAVKHPGSYAGDIATLRQRLERYERRCFSFCVTIDFSDDFSKIDGNIFLTILKNECGMKFMAEGVDFHCGYKGLCGAEQIRAFAKKNGIEVSFFAPVCYENQRISSSVIRQCILRGDFAAAEKMLGRPYIIDFEGIVPVEFDGTYVFSRSCFFQVIPPDGVYDVLETTSGLRACLEVTGDSILVRRADNELPRIRNVQFLYKE